MVKLYDKTGDMLIANLENCIECFVEEERNGIFELRLIYPTFDTNFNSLIKENIVISNANDILRNQKFRIYHIGKEIANKVQIYARHISFDLMYDFIEKINIENQSCEYALNTIFRNSQFSRHYRGYSDIVNAQDFKIEMIDCLSAIAGSKGSIIDTFGTGAEILRDNESIHVLNKRGHDNSVTIEYGKNLTGFNCIEDTTDLITRIFPYAKYTPEGEEEIIVKGIYVDSDFINNFSHPYIKHIDFSDKFEDNEVPTLEKLRTLSEKYFKENKCDIPKLNYKIEFLPLSKCIGYEDLEDKISLCDVVTVKHKIYKVDTKVKVIKTVFNVLKDRYESMELGEPKTSLGDIIGSGENGEDGKTGPPGPQGPPGVDGKPGDLNDFPDTLPNVPNLTAKVYGFASIELNWTFEGKLYYNYELYASKVKDFTPNIFDLIHAGQTSSFLFQAKPNETWYFKCCAVNSHGNRTEFSAQITVTTTKIDDLSNYVGEMAIGEALIGTLSLDRGWVGQLKGNWIDAKQLSVTDGNGKRTLDIDSYGNVNLDVASLKIKSKDVATKTELSLLDDKIEHKVDSGEFGTLISQNAYAVKIAWNNISNYVQFENGGISIYNGETTALQKRSVFDENGNHFWRDGYYLGKIGTNKYSDNNSLKGFVFDLEMDGAYMSWAVKKNSSSNYMMMWSYANKTVGNYGFGKLHAGCDIDMHNYYLRNVNFEGGGINGTMNFVQITSMNSNGTAGSWYNNCKLQFQNGILINATWG